MSWHESNVPYEIQQNTEDFSDLKLAMVNKGLKNPPHDPPGRNEAIQPKCMGGVRFHNRYTTSLLTSIINVTSYYVPLQRTFNLKGECAIWYYYNDITF